jgi:heat shock protein HslJ/membrane-bound inhibitor of C-type lysozyme
MYPFLSMALGLALALDAGVAAIAIQASPGQLAPPAPVEFACDEAAQPLFATFYNQAKPAAVALTYGNEQVIAFSAPAASGARYAATGVEFWEHQGVANVTWSGKKLTCRPRRPAQDDGSGRVSLAGSAWRLVAFQSMDDTRLQPEAGKQFTLAFDADGALRVQADCNRGRATWSSTDNVSLTIGPAAMTRAMCQSAIYDRFVRDLTSMRSFILKDGRLYLSLPVDSGIYEFERQATP